MHGTTVLDNAVARPSDPDGDGAATDTAWVRWTRSAPGGGAGGATANAVVDGQGRVALDADPTRLDVSSARLLDGTPVSARAADGAVVVEVPAPGPDGPAGPAVVAFDLVDAR